MPSRLEDEIAAGVERLEQLIAASLTRARRQLSREARRSRKAEIAATELEAWRREVFRDHGQRLKALERKTDDLTVEIATLKDILYPRLWDEDIGGTPSDIPLYRLIPLRAYVGGETGTKREVNAIAKSVEELALSAGFEPDHESPARVGSWFKEWRARSKDRLRSPEMAERLAKLEQAAELKLLGQPQAESDELRARAAAELLTVLPKDRPAAVQIGSVLILSVPDRGVIARTLTNRELIQLERNQDLLSNPETMLARLSELCRGGDEPSRAAPDALDPGD
jgi:hypothetical protein